jgi:SAM-dependent methyltransferase
MSALVHSIYPASVVLDSALAKIARDFADHGAFRGMATAQTVLSQVRAAAGTAWPRLVATSITGHPVIEIMRRCPLTRRCALKPRGYAGDAEVLDYIYGLTKGPDATFDPVGHAVHGYAVAAPACRAVRYRRYRLANLIDKEAESRVGGGAGNFRVLSVAAGHARELSLSEAFKCGLVSRFVALDQDSESLEVIEREYGGPNVMLLPLSVRSLLAGKHDLGTFDVIYAAGLYDYLQTSMARRLTARLFDNLKPGGVLLYVNFAPGIPNAGYMETAMDWWLIYRNARETCDLASEVPAEDILNISQYTDPDSNMHFVELRRRGPVS